MQKLFVNAETEAGLNAAIAEGTMNAEVAFVEESGKEGIHAKGKTYQTIPSNGKDGQVLISANGKGVWSDLNLEEVLSYGVSWKPEVADPELTRVGNINYHKTLPIQSQMRGCVYNCKSKKVVYWLDEHDWRFVKEGYKSGFQSFIDENVESVNTFYLDQEGDFAGYLTSLSSDDYPILWTAYMKNPHTMYARLKDPQVRDIVCIVELVGASNGSGNALRINPLIDNEENRRRLNSWIEAHENPEITQWEFGSDCTGFDGEVMVYVPAFYIKSWDKPDQREVRISLTKIDDTWEYQPPMYLGAYRDTIIQNITDSIRSAYGYVGTFSINAAVSIANYWDFCKGGENRVSNDSNWQDIFQRDLGKPRTNIERKTFRQYARNVRKELLSYKQYKNLYWLYVIEYANFNSQAPYTDELTVEGFHQGGLGKGITNLENWNSYNFFNPICPNGYTNDLGNGTGIKLIEPSGPAPVGEVYANRWRGIENPFGDIYTNLDGIVIQTSADDAGNWVNEVYITDNPDNYGDDITVMTRIGFEPQENGFIKEWDLGHAAHIIPRSVGGDTTQYKCDYYNFSINQDQSYTLIVGGCAHDGASAGLGHFDSNYGVSGSDSHVGFRSVSS